jgi:hypothetical protein
MCDVTLHTKAAAAASLCDVRKACVWALLPHVTTVCACGACRASRKQQHPQCKPAAAAAAADARRLLGVTHLGDDDDDQQQHGGMFDSMLQHMSAAGVDMRPAGGGGGEGEGTPAAAAAAGGPFSGDQSALQSMLVLVREDVDRLAQHWRDKEGRKLQANAADVWQR